MYWFRLPDSYEREGGATLPWSGFRPALNLTIIDTMPTNEYLRNAIRKAQPMSRAATFNRSSIGKKSVAYEGRTKTIVTFKPSPIKGEPPIRTIGTRPFAQRFTLADIKQPQAPKKR